MGKLDLLHMNEPDDGTTYYTIGAINSLLVSTLIARVQPFGQYIVHPMPMYSSVRSPSVVHCQVLNHEIKMEWDIAMHMRTGFAYDPGTT